MLHSLTLEGLRSFDEATAIRVAPLTLLAGANNTGKSTAIQAILAFLQSEQTQTQGALSLSGAWCDLGAFDQVVSYRRPRNEGFGFAIGLAGINGAGQAVDSVWTFGPDAEPPLPEDPPWRAEAMRHLALHALFMQGTMACALSYGAGSDLNEAVYRFLLGEQAIKVENFRGHAALAARLDAIESQGLRGAAAVLEAAAARLPGRLVVLDRARDSARRWVLDCSEATLLRALGGLDVYAASLDAGLSREVAAKRYYEATSVEMSQESAEVWKSPTCRRQREMDVPGRGKQYFDMHAKPGGSTRIHVWTEKVGAAHVVYVGHCGEHLLLPGGKR